MLILGAGAVAYWLNQRRRERQGRSADYDEDGIPENRPRPPVVADMEEAERTRRIQDEIRRKIMERRGAQTAPPPEVAPRPVAMPTMPDLMDVLRPREEPEERPVSQEALERQRALAARLEELEAQREAARRQAAQAAAAVQARAARAIVAAASAKRQEEHDWLAALRNSQNARRAIVLREVLGPPVGLR
ncbi:MAG TPA: hypothetical protein VGD81_06705 [Opitutaceae bacterium]